MRQDVSADGLSAVIEHAARLIHARGFAQGLNPAQWTALRYFDQAQSRSCTIARLAKFQDLSIAPVARSVHTLVTKGYLEARPNPGNKKADLYVLTRQGKLKLRQDPRYALTAILMAMPAEERERLLGSMRTIVEGLWEASQAEKLEGEVLVQTAVEEGAEAPSKLLETSLSGTEAD